jgi:hypothetical protein
MVGWVRLRCNAYWSPAVCTLTGSTQAPDFGALFNDIQYKKWNCPNIPKKYLADTKSVSAAGANMSGSAGGAGSQAGSKNFTTPKDTRSPPTGLQNPAYQVKRGVGSSYWLSNIFPQKDCTHQKGFGHSTKDGKWCSLLFELAHQRSLLESL